MITQNDVESEEYILEQLEKWPNSIDLRIGLLPSELQLNIYKYWWPYEKRRRELLLFPFITKELPEACKEDMLELKNASKDKELKQMQAYIAGMQLYDHGINRVCVIRRLLSNPRYVSKGEIKAYELRNDPDILQYIQTRKQLAQLQYADAFNDS